MQQETVRDAALSERCMITTVICPFFSWVTMSPGLSVDIFVALYFAVLLL
jgi:hypothetical protein